MPIINMLPGGGGGARIPLEPCTDLALIGLDSKVLVAWTDPENKYATPGGELVSEWLYSVVVRKEGSSPTSPTDGILVVKSTIKNQYSEKTFEDNGLQNGITYYYAVYAYTTYGVVNIPIVLQVTPEKGIRFYKRLENFYNENGSVISDDSYGHSCALGGASVGNAAIFAGGSQNSNMTPDLKSVNIYTSDLVHILGESLVSRRYAMTSIDYNSGDERYALFACGDTPSSGSPLGTPHTSYCEGYDSKYTRIPYFDIADSYYQVQAACSSDHIIIGGGCDRWGRTSLKIFLCDSSFTKQKLNDLAVVHYNYHNMAHPLGDSVAFVPTANQLGSTVEIYSYDGTKKPSADLSVIPELAANNYYAGMNSASVGDYLIYTPAVDNYNKEYDAICINSDLTVSRTDPVINFIDRTMTSSIRTCTRGILGFGGVSRAPDNLGKDISTCNICSYNESLTLEIADETWPDTYGTLMGAAVLSGDFIIYAGGYNIPAEGSYYYYDSSPNVLAYTY